jgi:1-deoxy-D-xylulose-5-phosphate reductoisomerase
VAVAAFLDEKITFLQIEDLIEKALSKHDVIQNPDLSIIQEVDKEARKYVQTLL